MKPGQQLNTSVEGVRKKKQKEKEAKQEITMRCFEAIKESK